MEPDMMPHLPVLITAIAAFVALALYGRARTALAQSRSECHEARCAAEGWRDVAVAEGLGEGDNEDALPWEPEYLHPPQYDVDEDEGLP
jgi:hypothetical protein